MPNSNQPAEKALAAVLSRPPADVSDAEIECAMRLAMPGCHAKVDAALANADAKILHLCGELKRELDRTTSLQADLSALLAHLKLCLERKGRKP